MFYLTLSLQSRMSTTKVIYLKSNKRFRPLYIHLREPDHAETWKLRESCLSQTCQNCKWEAEQSINRSSVSLWRRENQLKRLRGDLCKCILFWIFLLWYYKFTPIKNDTCLYHVKYQSTFLTDNGNHLVINLDKITDELIWGIRV